MNLPFSLMLKLFQSLCMFQLACLGMACSTIQRNWFHPSATIGQTGGQDSKSSMVYLCGVQRSCPPLTGQSIPLAMPRATVYVCLLYRVYGLISGSDTYEAHNNCRIHSSPVTSDCQRLARRVVSWKRLVSLRMALIHSLERIDIISLDQTPKIASLSRQLWVHKCTLSSCM